MFQELYGAEGKARNEKAASQRKDVFLEQNDLGEEGKVNWEETALCQDNSISFKLPIKN